MPRSMLALTLVLLTAGFLALTGDRTASGAACASSQQADCLHVIGRAQDETNEGALPGSVTASLPPAPPDPLLGLRAGLLAGESMKRLPTRVDTASSASSELHWPVSGPITQPFGVPELGVGPPHTGIDIGQDSGSPVHAAQSGRVVFAGGDPCCGLGYWLEINHGDGYSTRYGHLMRPPVVVAGQIVSQGQIVGFSGNTGFSTGPHVHFEVRTNGTPIDPLRAIPSR